jgi:O-antigen/teichoic acid export membrane protein
LTSSLRTQAASGVVWSAVQTWGVRLTTALAFIVISRQLSPTAFGLVALCMSVVAVLTLISDVGMATYLIRKPSVSQSDSSTAFWTSLIMASVLATTLALGAGGISNLFDEPDMRPLLWTLAGGLIIAGAGSVPTALLKRELKFKTLAYRGTTATLIGSAVAITLALLGAGAWALVAQSLVRGLLAAVLSFAAAKWWPSRTYDRRMARKMLGFGGTVLGIDLLNQVRDRGEDFILGSVAGTVALGYWAVAGRLVSIIRETGTSVVLSVATPTFARLQHDHARLVRAFETTLYTSAAVMFPAMAFLTVMSPDLVPLILGQQWAVTAETAQIVALTTAIATMSWFDRTVFISVGRLGPEIAMVAAFAAVHVAVVAAVAHQPIVVLAWALLLKGCFLFPIRAVVLHRVAAIPYRVYRSTARVGLAAGLYLALGLTTAALLDEAAVALRVTAGAVVALVVYPVALWLIARPVWRSLLADLSNLGRRRQAQSAVATSATGAGEDLAENSGEATGIQPFPGSRTQA